MRPSRLVVVFAVLACIGVCGSVFADGERSDPAAIDTALGALALDLPAARQVENVELHVGAGLLKLTKGALFPTHRIDGEAPELVFVGDARFSVTPPNEVEAGQLELFTGRRAFDEPLVAVVLAGGDPALRQTLSAALGAGQPVADASAVAAAKEHFTAWTGRTARGLHVRRDLLRRAVDPRYRSYTLAHLFQAAGKTARCSDVGGRTRAMSAACPVVALVRPEQPEPFTFGQPVHWILNADDRFVAQYALGAAQAHGRSLDVDLDELTSLDTWMQFSVPDAAGVALPNGPGIEVTRYVLDVAVDAKGDGLEGRATLTVAPLADGVRWIDLSLNPDLRVQSVTAGAGEACFFVQSGPVVSFLVPRDLAPGVPVDVTVAYRGTALVKLGWKRYQPTDTVLWYPHGPTVHGATYDATFRWPKKFDVLAAGRRVDGGEKDGSRWERRTFDTPVPYFGLAVGDFDMDERVAGHVKLHIGYDRKWQSFVGPGVKDTLAANLQAALAFYETVFGPYPYDELTVVMNEAPFAQGMPGFVTLSTTSMDYVLHEIAHQWWGGIVVPKSPHDAWLSEGMAEFAMRFALRHGKTSSLAGSSAGSVTAWTAANRVVEQVGPVWLGPRLDSSLCACATPITYTKGAQVLDMLAQITGESAFAELLRTIVATRKEPLSTADFLAEVQKLTAVDIGEFARAFVYGTGMFDLYYSYRTELDPAGGYRTHLAVEKEPWQDSRYAIDVGADGSLDVIETCRAHGPAPATVAVPYQARVKPPATTPPQHGTIALHDARAEVTLSYPAEPVIDVDPMDVVPGRSLDQSAKPKSVLRERASWALCRGDLDAAERWARESLAAPLTPRGRPERSDWRQEYDRGVALQDAWTQCILGRILLRRGDLAGARAVLDTARALYPLDPAKDDELAAFSARVRLREGDVAGAYTVLWRTFVENDAHPVENWALLALLAKQRGERNWYEQALAVAKRREVDVHRLEEMP